MRFSSFSQSASDTAAFQPDTDCPQSGCQGVEGEWAGTGLGGTHGVILARLALWLEGMEILPGNHA